MSEVSVLPVMLIVFPILMAIMPIILGLRFDRTGWPIAVGTSLVLVVVTGAMAAVVYGRGEPIVHALGGFNGPVGIELVADELSTLVALLISLVVLGVLLYTRTAGPRGNTIYSMYLLLTGGLLGVAVTGDAFNLFVFLEITGIATYALIASGGKAESAYASLKYLILGTVGASLYLLGVGFLFMATGTLNMADLGSAISTLGSQEPLLRIGFVFILVGLSLKVAQWPLHTWQPDAYQHAPDGFTPLIAALVSTVSAYAMARVFFEIFGVGFIESTPYLTELIVAIGSVSVVVGSGLAVIQQDVKRMLAYSSVAQFGLIVAAYGLLTEVALLGAIVHLVGHGLMKGGLFLAVAMVALSTGARTVDEYAGLARRRPLLSAMIAVLLVAMVGLPPTIGFVGKWYIALGAIQAEVWSVAAVVLLSTLFTLAYSARLLEKMYVTPAATSAIADGGETDPNRLTGGMYAVLVLCVVLVVALGFAGGTLFELLEPFLSGVSP
ncbi:MAG: proton-conducting transporter membrane subunit [Natrialbaceae archaeon]|nr:proton-conducting transporter membrane subunit [Natrialbaceae archaeon]